MSLDRIRLIDLATSTGFRPETLEKVDRLVGLLDDFGRHPLLSSVLALKGGTALNLAFGPPRRLSVDLDFNYIGAAGRDAMREERPAVEQAIERIARAQGYRVQRSKEEHAGHKYFLGYRGAFGSTGRRETLRPAGQSPATRLLRCHSITGDRRRSLEPSPPEPVHRFGRDSCAAASRLREGEAGKGDAGRYHRAASPDVVGRRSSPCGSAEARQLGGPGAAAGTDQSGTGILRAATDGRIAAGAPVP